MHEVDLAQGGDQWERAENAEGACASAFAGLWRDKRVIKRGWRKFSSRVGIQRGLCSSEFFSWDRGGLPDPPPPRLWRDKLVTDATALRQAGQPTTAADNWVNQGNSQVKLGS
jgi:hypothetical protein